MERIELMTALRRLIVEIHASEIPFPSLGLAEMMLAKADAYSSLGNGGAGGSGVG
jgi:hypothetical protein